MDGRGHDTKLSRKIAAVPENWHHITAIAEATLYQVYRDFAMGGVPLPFLETIEESLALIPALAKRLEEISFLKHRHFQSVLYRIDLPQKAWMLTLEGNPISIVYLDLAEAILERCFQKVIWRLKLKAF